jgi:hypothetical protein
MVHIAIPGEAMQEKRAHTRRLMHEDAVLAEATGQGRQPVILLDISRLGVCFTCPAPLEGGARHILDFRLPGGAQLHETVVQVVHSGSAGVPAGFRIGARFVHVPAETESAIVQFVSSSAPA